MSRGFLLPSGKLVTRFWSGGEFNYQIPVLGSAEWVTLDEADIRRLATIARDADSLDDDGNDGDRCTHPDGHEWREGEPDRAGEGPVRCVHCGADGDA